MALPNLCFLVPQDLETFKFLKDLGVVGVCAIVAGFVWRGLRDMQRDSRAEREAAETRHAEREVKRDDRFLQALATERQQGFDSARALGEQLREAIQTSSREHTEAIRELTARISATTKNQ